MKHWASEPIDGLQNTVKVMICVLLSVLNPLLKSVECSHDVDDDVMTILS